MTPSGVPGDWLHLGGVLTPWEARDKGWGWGRGLTDPMSTHTHFHWGGQ